MALSDTLLSTELQTEIGSALNITDPAQLKSVCDAIAKAVVDHIKNNGQVSGTCTGVTGTGPQGGPLPIAAQPVTGTIL